LLEPIRFDSVRRNEVGKTLPYGTARQAAYGGESDLVLFADEERQQRASLLLRDVAYIIDAHFELTPDAGPTENAGKHADMARRRITRGQCVQQPCFGCREFPAFFEPVPPDTQFDAPAELLGRRDHLLDLEGAHERKAKRDRPGIAHAAARNLGVFVYRIGDFPPRLDPHQQGLFFTGYHHQRQARFAGRAEEVAETDDYGSDQTREE